PTLIGNRRLFFLSIAGTTGDGTLTFRAYDALEDRIREVQPSLAFDPLRPTGTVGDPLVWTPFGGGGPPDWDVDPSDFPSSMGIVGQITEAGRIVSEAGASVAAFLDGELRGTASVQDASGRVFLTVFGTVGETGGLTFQVYRPSVDRTSRVTATVPFAPETSAGTLAAPVALPLRLGVSLSGPEGWHMLTPAGTDATIATVLGPLWTQGFEGASTDNGLPNVYRYDEPTGGYVAATSATEAWPRGAGRFVFVYEDDNLRTDPIEGGFPKTLPSGGIGPESPFDFALTRTPGNGAPEGEGWNLLGNPFNDPLDWDLGWTRTDVSNSVYVWDPAHLGGSYRVWNGAVGSLADGVIPRGAAFWGQAESPSAVLRAPAEARVLPASVSAPTEADVPTLALRLASETRAGLGADAWVSFQEGASAVVDPRDAWVLAPLVADYVSLGFVSPVEGRLFAVDAREPGLRERVSIPLEVGAVADGAPITDRLVLSWPTLDVPEAWHLVLMDTEAGREIDLRETGSYRFRVSARAAHAPDPSAPLALAGGPGGVGEGSPARFRLVFTPRRSTSSPSPASVRLSLGPPSPNPSRGEVAFEVCLPTPGLVRLDLHDALGRRVWHTTEARSAGCQTVRVDGRSFPPGVYSARLRVDGETRVQRVTLAR
ncbi:MAG: hypothetical protein AAF791_12210, partial [Bacteroidota bacterium]